MFKKITITIGILILAIFVSAGGYWGYEKLSEKNIVEYIQTSINKKAEPVIPSVTLTFGGDIMLDRGVERSVEKNFAGDFFELFKNVAPILQNDDISFANLEGPVSDLGRNVGSIYSFRMNPVVLPVLKNAGIDIVSFANNHVGDYSKVAFDDTIQLLEKNNIAMAGAGTNYSDAKNPTIIEKNDMRIGYLAFTDVGPNWLSAKEESSGILLASDPNFSQIISEAKINVDVLVVSVHWGDEYKPHNKRQAELAHLAIDAGADIIAGHHPHVAQDIEIYKDKLIIYSMGNFIFDQYFSEETMQGLIVQLKVNKNGVISNIKEYTSHLSKQYAIEKLTEKNPTEKINSTETEINIGWVGDIPPSNVSPNFSPTVLAQLQYSDLMVGNLEGAISPELSLKCLNAISNCFSFVGNDLFIKNLKNAGFDILSLANNHALDSGATGLISTKNSIKNNGLNYISENGEPTIINIKGIDTALIAFGTNTWTQKITDIPQAQKIIKNLASKYSIVVVIFHGGSEGENQTHVPKMTETYLGENRGDVYNFAHSAIDAGADMVLGSGPHVVRGIEKYKEKLIVYSAGNFLTTEGMSGKGLSGKGAIFNIGIDQNGLLKNLKIFSTNSEEKNSVKIDPENTALTKIIELSNFDFSSNISADQSGKISF